MNLQEIAIFKRFISQHELRKNFIKKYKKSIGLTKNPESIEQYLSNVEPEKAISSAIKHFITNEAMGYDFWQSVDISWQAYLHKMRSNYTIEHEEAETLRGYYSALREDWDKEKPWIYDPISVAKLRYGLIVPEQSLEDAKEDEVQEEIDDAEPLVKLVEEDDPLADFDFFDSPTPTNVRLKPDEVSLNFNNGSYKITFNKAETEAIKKMDMTFARLAKNRIGDICLILNRREGSRLSRTISNGRDNITINSKDIATKLRTLLNVKPDYSILNIKQLNSTSDYLIYKISKQV